MTLYAADLKGHDLLPLPELYFKNGEPVRMKYIVLAQNNQ